jgi:membrane-bound lytic murein transglycosylase A
MSYKSSLWLGLSFLAVAGCATSPSQEAVSTNSGPAVIAPVPAATTLPAVPARAPEPTPVTPTTTASVIAPTPRPSSSAAPVAPIDIVPLSFGALDFAAIPDWASTDISAARRAMVRSCASIQRRPASSLMSNIATYSGRVSDWAGVCTAASDANVDDRSYWESNFQAWAISVPAGAPGRLTGYYEPIMAARRIRDAIHSEPIQSRPADLLEIDMGAFDPALRARSFVGRVEGNKVVPYPPRAQITADSAPVLAWGEPAEVLSLQVQGSGRLQFEDGTQIRAAFAAHNGQRFGSNAQELIRRGHLTPTGASLDALKNWFKTASPQESREVLNANPRTVFFRLQPITDPSAGPTGGQSIALEPNGSMAVDTSYHAYGVPIFVAADAPRVALTVDKTIRRLMIAQDTGGAIKGPLRGDLFWGTGPEAGLRAGRINHDTRFWVLLPKGMNPNALAATAAPLANR